MKGKNGPLYENLLFWIVIAVLASGIIFGTVYLKAFMGAAELAENSKSINSDVGTSAAYTERKRPLPVKPEPAVKRAGKEEEEPIATYTEEKEYEDYEEKEIIEEISPSEKKEEEIEESVYLNPVNTMKQINLPKKYLMDIEKSPGTDRQYLGQPDMVKTRTGRLITVYPIGHGKGPLVMRYSDNRGDTWKEIKNLPESFKGSQETPTLYTLNMKDGRERLILITGCPGWGEDSYGNRTGFNTSVSDDNGETWSEYNHWYSKLNGRPNKAIVAMASLIRLKDEDGNYIDKWMGVYHNYDFQNYKTILSFDENGNEQWSKPVSYLSEHREKEKACNMCEIGMFRSPDGNRIVGLARTNSHNSYSTMIYSDDEGKTWHRPLDLPGSLAGERHKPLVINPETGRMIISMREIRFDLNGNGRFDGDSDWECGDWICWVGTYDQLMNREDGDYRIRIAEDYSGGKGGDTGYAGIVCFDDGTIVTHSYGHFDKEFSERWRRRHPIFQNHFGKKDLCYIKQGKFNINTIDKLNK